MRPFAVRWVAAAAAAGLVIGVYAGSHMTTGGPGAIADASLTRIAAPAARTAQETSATLDVPASRSDEDILSEVEIALVTQRAPALVAIDALTPRVSEIGLRIR